MNRAILPAILVAVMILMAASAAFAAPKHKVNYVKVGMTDDGRPVYVAIIQMNYMNAELAARLFGGTAVSGQNSALARPPVTKGYSGRNSDALSNDNPYRNNSYSGNSPYNYGSYATPYSYSPGYGPTN